CTSSRRRPEPCPLPGRPTADRGRGRVLRRARRPADTSHH
ncbi:MAG: hypothetical protein AVDCRST_MAG16-1215, partial [uncultured Frankineae bacterium]